MEPFVLVNDQFHKAGNAGLLIHDLSIQRGYGVFDFFKTVGGVPVLLNDHLERLYSSAQQMRLVVRKPLPVLKETLFELMRLNNLPNSGIRITLTGGYSKDGYSLHEPNLIITQQPLTVSTTILSEGLQLITYPHQRQLPHVKSLDYMMAIWLQDMIIQHGAHEVLYHDNRNISECPRANFYIVNSHHQVVTSPRNVLKGVIRKQLTENLRCDFEVIEKDITLSDLNEAKEAFITSTTRNIQPVFAINKNIINGGAIGPITTYLSNCLQQLIHKDIEQFREEHQQK